MHNPTLHTRLSLSQQVIRSDFSDCFEEEEKSFSVKRKKLQEYGACEMQILQIGDLGWKQTG